MLGKEWGKDMELKGGGEVGGHCCWKGEGSIVGLGISDGSECVGGGSRT